MPPLAPFAHLSGTVAPALARPGAAITLDTAAFHHNVWYDPRAVVDGRGRWALEDMLPGQHRLLLASGRGEAEPVTVTALPGEQIGGIAVGPKKPPSEQEALITALLHGPGPPAVTLPADAPVAPGRVTQADGAPVAGADVYAVCASYGARDRSQTVLTAKTDAAGAYLILGLPNADGQTGPSVHLVAHLPGFGLAVAEAQSEKGRASGRWMDVRRDLVLPASHAGLTVRALQDGQPVPGVLIAVTAQEEHSLIPEFFHQADRGEAAQALRTLLSPSARTGPDGAARFTDLTPGLWDVTANRAPDSGPLFRGNSVAPFNISTGVIVRAGEDVSYPVSLLPPPKEIALRLLSPGGLPPVVPKEISLATASQPYYGSLTLTPDGAGNGRAERLMPGLFQVTARFGDRPLDGNAPAGTYSEGTAWVAVSPATPTAKPTDIPARQFGQASLRVRLQDARGRPLGGTVTVTPESSSDPLYAASAGADGAVFFSDMPTGKYTVTSRLAGPGAG